MSLRGKFEPKPVLAASSHDVLIVTCAGAGFPGGGFANLFYSQGSSGAPAVTATTCAQALANALDAGFTVSSTIPYGNAPGDVYTLVRGGQNSQ
jgi:hypothetical protein